MARRRYRRYRRRSGRWSPNIVKLNDNIQASPGEWFGESDLALNPAQVSTGVSQVFTVKNIEITFTLETSYSTSASQIESVTAYIMYVPQGMNVTSSYYAEHPEYILAYKYLGSPTTYSINNTSSTTTAVPESQNYQPYRVRSRLSRKLQTGDRIILYLQGSNENQSQSPLLLLSGLVRWWTKAN